MFSATPEQFASEVRYLRDHFQLIGPEELPTLADPDYVPDEPTALITFDDGYRDNIDHAFPILRDLHSPAAFFITTDFIDRPRLPWWDHVTFALSHTHVKQLVLELPEPLTLDLRPESCSRSSARLIEAYLRAAPDDEPRNLDHLNERAGLEIDSQGLGRLLFMNWDDIRALDGAGMIVGSHGVAHRNFARRSEDAQAKSLSESKQILERALGREVIAFAYPYGGPDDFTAATVRLAREAGYRVGFALKNRVDPPGTHHPLAIPRLVIGSADSPTLFRARLCLTASFGSSPL